MVPHLITALTGPINELEARILESMPAIERWFRLEWMEHTPPLYATADLRNAGFKLAPVDVDLFPAGFHHLAPQMLPLAVQAAMAAIEKICPEAKNLLLIPRRGPRSSFYLSHLQRLVEVFNQAGLNVRLGALDDDITAPTAVAVPEGGELLLEPLLRGPRRLGLKGFDPCTVLLNDDLGAGTPALLTKLHEQYLLPPLHAGWGVRQRSVQSRNAEEVAKKFAKLLGMDPWLLHPVSASVAVGQANGAHAAESLQHGIDAVLSKVRRKYKDYAINERPFVVIKPDRGSTELRFVGVRDAKELANLEPTLRQALLDALERGGSGLLVQEGVPACERVNDALAEPVVCLIDRYVVGGWYRVHASLAGDAPLTALGARYVPLAFAESHRLPRRGEKPGASAPNRFYMYGVVARLALLAAAYELEASDPDAEVYD